MDRKRLATTQREIVIGKDKSRCHRELLRQSRVYPFDVYCPNCSKAMKYEDEIIFHKKSKVDKFVGKWAEKIIPETINIARSSHVKEIEEKLKQMLKEYDEINCVA